MADAKKKDYQLLADGMIVDGVAKERGDTITIDAEHGERLAGFGAVGPVGILERRAEAEVKAQKLRADAEKAADEAVAASQDPDSDAPGDARRQVRRSGS